jgi:hypothetical protein
LLLPARSVAQTPFSKEAQSSQSQTMSNIPAYDPTDARFFEKKDLRSEVL